MSLFSKKIYYCANCGKKCFGLLEMHNVLSMLCSDHCRDEYELKYAQQVLGK